MAQQGRLIRVEVALTHLDGFTAYFGHNLRLSRHEPGCIQFRAARSLSEEQEGGPAIFHVWEEFTDEAAMRAHHASAHFQRWSAWRAEQGDAIVRITLATEPWPGD